MADEESVDYYQERYKAHQDRKRESLRSYWGTLEFEKYSKEVRSIFSDLTTSRKSQRLFNSEKITATELAFIRRTIDRCPSSCDRHGVRVHAVHDRDEKELLGGLLVGGVGWIHRADIILLLWAARRAYKAVGEMLYMPFLDAGVIVGNTYLACEALNIGCCFVNPNVRDINKVFFHETFGFGEDVFCGALALGKYDRKAT